MSLSKPGSIVSSAFSRPSKTRCFPPPSHDVFGFLETATAYLCPNIEYQIYLHPLSKNMTQEEVKQLWGTKIKGLKHETDNKTWTKDVHDYEIGISLYFKNNKLEGWKTYNTPGRYTASKNTNIINYNDLQKEPPINSINQPNKIYSKPAYQAPQNNLYTAPPHNQQSQESTLQQQTIGVQPPLNNQLKPTLDPVQKALEFLTSVFIFFVLIPLIVWIIALIDILRNEFTG
jgi:hypothetical protein